MTCEYHAEDQKNLENFRAVTESGGNALNFDHISQLSWESDQKGGIVNRETTHLKWSHLG